MFNLSIGAAGDPALARTYAKELVGMQPDVIVGHTTPVAAALAQATHAIPVVFISITDPVRDGFISSMAHPGGNMTGFTNYEFSMGAKWLEILKEIAPSTVQVSLLLNPDTGSYYVDYLRSVETVALAHSVQATLAPVHNSDEIETAVAALGAAGGGGLIVLPSAPVTASIQVHQATSLGSRLDTAGHSSTSSAARTSNLGTRSVPSGRP